MLKHGTRQPSLTLSLYDLKVPQTHLLRRIAAVVDFSFVSDLLKDGYHEKLGRPAKEPELMLKLLFLEFLYDLSDEDVVARASTDLAFLWFLGVLPEDQVPEASLLSKFRRHRLGLERTKTVLAQIVDQCRAKGLVGDDRIIVDSTDISADTEVLYRSHVKRRAVKKLLRAVAAEDAELAREVTAGLVKYNPSTAQAEEERQAQANLDHAIARVQEAVDSGRLATGKVRQRLQTAHQVAEGARSTTDPDARFGRKGRLGYQQQLAMTEENEIIVGVRVTPGDEPDIQHLVPLVSAVEESHPGIVKAVTTDKGYDSGKNRADLQGQGIETFIAIGVPEAEMLKQKGIFSRDDFHLDDHRRLVCPAGKTSSRTKRDADHPHDTKYIFRKKDCKNCPLRDQCTTNKNTGRTVRISDYREIEEAAQQQATTPQYQAAMTARKAIERKQAEEVRFHGLRRARYRGLAYVTIQALFTAIAVNAKRMAALLCPLRPQTA
jgi:transposase